MQPPAQPTANGPRPTQSGWPPLAGDVDTLFGPAPPAQPDGHGKMAEKVLIGVLAPRGWAGGPIDGFVETLRLFISRHHSHYQDESTGNDPVGSDYPTYFDDALIWEESQWTLNQPAGQGAIPPGSFMDSEGMIDMTGAFESHANIDIQDFDFTSLTAEMDPRLADVDALFSPLSSFPLPTFPPTTSFEAHHGPSATPGFQADPTL
ncbi:hypothetical protein ACJZ2D_006635 [Fusarium nematophilum]